MHAIRTLAVRSLLGFLAGVALLGAPAHAQLFHGAMIGKGCDLLCPGAQARCEISVENVDDFGDALRVDEVCDVVHHASGDVKTCKDGAPFILEEQGDFVTFEHVFTVAPDDPNPLGDLATSTGVDLLGPSSDPSPSPTPFSISFPSAIERAECCVDADCNDGNVCTVDTCNLDTNTCVFTPGNAGTICRPSAGVCDPAEVCDGTNAACPADAKSTAVCRPSAGVCDPAEVCDGASNDCGPDVLSTSATVCRAAAGVCDVAENCTGSSAACPPDAKSTAVCRPSAGVCDTPESCDGTSNDCPPDAFASSATVCRAGAGVCDVAENCTGSSADCPPDTKSTAVCRPSTGVCDVPESCDGTSNDCPPDAFQPSSVVCRAAAGVCDVAENCTGSGPNCPADAVAPSGTTCRAPGALCDRTCDGTGKDCPAECPDAGVQLTTPTPSIAAGDTAVYDIVVMGNGPGTSTNVMLTDELPGGLTWIASGPDSGDCDIMNNVLKCNFGDIPEGAMKKVTVSAATNTASCPGIEDSASITSDIDTNPANDTAGPVPIAIECPSPGCRITGGGQIPTGGVDLDKLAETLRANFGGQVGSPCGCVGCFDEFDHIQGSWQYDRKNKRGTFHAKDFNSLVCGCDGRLDGKICEGDGPAPPRAPANNACFSGVADFSTNNGPKTQEVAFRVEVEDRGEPGTGDKVRVRVWIPSDSETAGGLADQVCCTNETVTIRTANIDDGGSLLGGNLQIHPAHQSSEAGICPKPRGVCVP